MFVGISNTPRPYAWGSTTAIAEQLGWVPSGGPEAELWLGAHPGSPSRILHPEETAGATDLAQWIAADPTAALAGLDRLPFLMKLLAAGAPLSLQAHPTAQQARDGFRRDNDAGLPIDAPNRNYRDEYPKPEVIYALSETFDALCGFRAVSELVHIVDELRALETADTAPLDDLARRASEPEPLRPLVGWLLDGGADVEQLVASVSALAEHPSAAAIPGMAVVATLTEEYPGDAGIVVSLLLNHVKLHRGEALYLPAGNIHAYVRGLGVEVMASSDNVLRGGLTPKHIDVPELMSVLDFRELPVPYLRPTRPMPGLEVFTPDVDDFRLVRYDGSASADCKLNGPAIAICTGGAGTVGGAHTDGVTLARGESVYITPDEGSVAFSGAGEIFMATTGGA